MPTHIGVRFATEPRGWANERHDLQAGVNLLELLREIGRERNIAVLYVLHLARRFAM